MQPKKETSTNPNLKDNKGCLLVDSIGHFMACLKTEKVNF